MDYKTLRQYADERGITYEATRRLVQKYRQQLGDHVIKKNRVQLLDEDAVEFLNERRRYSPLVVVREGNEERIAQLETQVEKLTAQLLAAQETLVQAQQEVIDLHKDLQNQLEMKTQYEALLEDKQQTRDELDRVKEVLDETQKQLRIAEIGKQAAEQEAGSYHRSWFGFYRKG